MQNAQRSVVVIVGDAQPVTLATIVDQLDTTSQYECCRSTASDAAAAATLSVATAMASVAMTVGYIYRSADAPATKLLHCAVPDDGSHCTVL